MPFIRITLSDVILEDKKKEILDSVSQIISEALSKPKQYIMVSLETSSIMMSGRMGQAAFIDLRSIGKINSKTNTQISKQICELLNKELDIPADRIFLNFSDIAGVNWGWNSSTFA